MIARHGPKHSPVQDCVAGWRTTAEHDMLSGSPHRGASTGAASGNALACVNMTFLEVFYTVTM